MYPVPTPANTPQKHYTSDKATAVDYVTCTMQEAPKMGKEVTRGAEGGKEVDGRLLVVSVQNLSTNRCTSNAPRPAVY